MNGEPTQAYAYTPCRWCISFDGLTAHGTAALCKHPRCSRLRPGPDGGCCLWEREPGADDDADPAALPYGRTLPWWPASSAPRLP